MLGNAALPLGNQDPLKILLPEEEKEVTLVYHEQFLPHTSKKTPVSKMIQS